MLTIIKKIIKYYSVMENQYKELAFIKLLDNLEQKKYEAITPKMQKKIEEYENTGHFADYDNILLDKNYKIYKKLSKIKGVGKKTIDKWIKVGVETIEDAKKLKLTYAQQLGLKYYNDLNTKISRKSVSKFEEDLRLITDNFIIVGSYRRKKKLIGDIDILVDDDTIFNYLYNNNKGILINGQQKKSILYKIGYVRQIDLLLVKNNYYTSLLYFTGPFKFNIHIRHIAKEKGYLLNEHGLFKNNKEVKINSEKNIFEILDIDYIKPENR